jgi:hypothetical protein
MLENSHFFISKEGDFYDCHLAVKMWTNICMDHIKPEFDMVKNA